MTCEQQPNYLLNTSPSFFGLPNPPLFSFLGAFSAPPSVSPRCFDTSGFPGLTSKGSFCSPFPETSFCSSGRVTLGSKAPCSSAAWLSVPDLVYSVASALMLFLSSKPFLGYADRGACENRRCGYRCAGFMRGRKNLRPGRDIRFAIAAVRVRIEVVQYLFL